MKKVIIIKKTGQIKSVILKSITEVSSIDIEDKHILTLFNSNIKKSKNFKNNFKRYCDWELEDTVLSLFGSKEGRSGSENKYDLPPPEDLDIYFGEILVVKSIHNTIIDMNIEDFNKFIEISFGGFENLGSKDTEEEYDPELDKYESDFVVDDNEDNIEYDEGYNPEEEEEEEEYKSSSNEEESNISDNEDTEDNEDYKLSDE